MRTLDSWFTFEGRCMLCGAKVRGNKLIEYVHIKRHVQQGYLNDELEQIKPHPIGFPGPPLGQQPPCSSPTSQG